MNLQFDSNNTANAVRKNREQNLFSSVNINTCLFEVLPPVCIVPLSAEWPLLYVCLYLSGCTTPLTLTSTVMTLGRSKKEKNPCWTREINRKLLQYVVFGVSTVQSVVSQNYLLDLWTKVYFWGTWEGRASSHSAWASCFPHILCCADCTLYKLLNYGSVWIQMFLCMQVGVTVIIVISCSRASKVKQTLFTEDILTSQWEKHRRR